MLATGTAAALLVVGGDVLTSAAPAAAAVTWGHPFTYRATPGSPYGPRGNSFHSGQDYPAPTNTPIYAVADGVVAEKGILGTKGAYGNAVYINHADGWSSRYAHMVSPSPLQVGQTVTRGQNVGRVGNTGHSFGSHLHIELRLNGGSVDPIPYIQNAPLAGTTTPTTPEETMPFFNHKQSTAALNFAANTTYYATFNGALVTSPTGVGDTDLAGSPAGGPGLYDLDVPFVFSSFVTGSVVRVNLAVQDISSGALDHWYQELFEGSASGEVRVTHSTKIIVPPNKRLFLRITPSANVRLDAWGRIVTNYQGVTG